VFFTLQLKEKQNKNVLQQLCHTNFIVKVCFNTSVLYHQSLFKKYFDNLTQYPLILTSKFPYLHIKQSLWHCCSKILQENKALSNLSLKHLLKIINHLLELNCMLPPDTYRYVSVLYFIHRLDQCLLIHISFL